MASIYYVPNQLYIDSDDDLPKSEATKSPRSAATTRISTPSVIDYGEQETPVMEVMRTSVFPCVSEAETPEELNVDAVIKEIVRIAVDATISLFNLSTKLGLLQNHFQDRDDKHDGKHVTQCIFDELEKTVISKKRLKDVTKVINMYL